MKKIFMYWWKPPEEKRENFGDVLGPYLVEKLSGIKVTYASVNYTGFVGCLRFTFRTLMRKQSFSELFNLVHNQISFSKTLITIGSVLEHYSKKDYYYIWGSGIIEEKAQIQNANFLAVRGKYTQNRLKELGYNAPNVIGDPALLAPLVYNPEIEKKYKLGIIPHIKQFEEMTKLVSNHNNILIINLFDDVEKVIRDVKSCNCTISSSLHGIIISHAYGIPSLWYNFPGGEIGGDNIKFFDYFSSIGIENYKPFEIEDFDNIDLVEIAQTANKLNDINVIRLRIIYIQKDLMRVAPFKIFYKYTNNI